MRVLPVIAQPLENHQDQLPTANQLRNFNPRRSLILGLAWHLSSASNTARAASEPTQLMVEVATSEGRQSGLLFDSAVQCENLVTIDCLFVIRKIGALPALAMQQIDECLKAALGLM